MLEKPCLTKEIPQNIILVVQTELIFDRKTHTDSTRYIATLLNQTLFLLILSHDCYSIFIPLFRLDNNYKSNFKPLLLLKNQYYRNFSATFKPCKNSTEEYKKPLVFPVAFIKRHCYSNSIQNKRYFYSNCISVRILLLSKSHFYLLDILFLNSFCFQHCFTDSNSNHY